MPIDVDADELELILSVTALLVDLPDHVSDDPRCPWTVLSARHPRRRVHEAAVAIESWFHDHPSEPLPTPDTVTADILRACVELNEWPAVYAERGRMLQAFERDVSLHSLAAKLRQAGVEITAIPQFWTATDLH